MTHKERSLILVTCPKGITPFLEKELSALGFPVREKTVAGIETEGTLDDTMRLNLYLRTAHRVLFLLKQFKARDAVQLYQEMVSLPWEEYISRNGYFSVTSSVHNPTISDSRFANLKCKDAIVDRIRKKTGLRPDSGPETDQVVVNLYWKEKGAAVYLDTSGIPLAKRGYRKIPLIAPLQETLAAAIVASTGYSGEELFINPMCGSGTLAIEAALIALHKAPGLLRSNFGFKHLSPFNEPLWRTLRREALNNALKKIRGKIIATDSDRKAVAAARKNAMTAGVDHLIEFKVCDFEKTLLPGKEARIVLNPPYGERMGDKKHLADLYRRIGDFFKQKCQGSRGYVFTGNLDLIEKIGLKTCSRTILFNGPLECRLLAYDLYPGSRRQRK